MPRVKHQDTKYPRTETEILTFMYCSTGDIIINPYRINCSIAVRNGKFIAIANDNREWKFERFEQLCYFMTMIYSKKNYEGADEIQRQALLKFPNKKEGMRCLH